MTGLVNSTNIKGTNHWQHYICVVSLSYPDLL